MALRGGARFAPALLLCLSSLFPAFATVVVTAPKVSWCLTSSPHKEYALSAKGKCILCDPTYWEPSPSNKFPCRCFKDGQCPLELQREPFKQIQKGRFRKCVCAPGWFGSPKGFPVDYKNSSVKQRAGTNRFLLGCKMCPFRNRGVKLPRTCESQGDTQCYAHDIVDEQKCKDRVVPKLIPYPCGDTSIFVSPNQQPLTPTPHQPTQPASPANNASDSATLGPSGEPPIEPANPSAPVPIPTPVPTPSPTAIPTTTANPRADPPPSTAALPQPTKAPGDCESKDDIGEVFGPGADANCKDLPQSVLDTSHWCDIDQWPPLLTAPSQPCRKIGRQTVFDGPVQVHRGYCAIPLRGRPDAALVAVSQKFIKQGVYPWGQDPVCGRCLCFKPLKPNWPKNDSRWNDKTLMQNVNARQGKPIKGFVGDLCGECDDYHVDVLMDVPYSLAPLTAANPAAKAVNVEYPEGKYPRFIPPGMAYFVGVWVIEWNWIDCDKKCDDF